MAISLILILFASGLAAGVLAGLLGIGGGLVVVPVVTWILLAQGAPADVAVPVAVATALGSMLLTSASAIFSHHRLGSMDLDCIRKLGLAVALGAVLGAWLAQQIPGIALARFFALVAFLIGIRMLWSVKPPVVLRTPRPRGWWVAGPLIGAASAMVGIGGGSFNVPFLTRNGYPMAQAVAIASACGYPIALAGSAAFIAFGWGAVDWPGTIGYWYWPGVLIVGLGGMLAAPLGARLAHRVPAAILRRIFGAFLVLVALRMAW